MALHLGVRYHSDTPMDSYGRRPLPSATARPASHVFPLLVHSAPGASAYASPEPGDLSHAQAPDSALLSTLSSLEHTPAHDPHNTLYDLSAATAESQSTIDTAMSENMLPGSQLRAYDKVAVQFELGDAAAMRQRARAKRARLFGDFSPSVTRALERASENQAAAAVPVRHTHLRPLPSTAQARPADEQAASWTPAPSPVRLGAFMPRTASNETPMRVTAAASSGSLQQLPSAAAAPAVGTAPPASSAYTPRASPRLPRNVARVTLAERVDPDLRVDCTLAQGAAGNQCSTCASPRTSQMQQRFQGALKYRPTMSSSQFIAEGLPDIERDNASSVATAVTCDAQHGARACMRRNAAQQLHREALIREEDEQQLRAAHLARVAAQPLSVRDALPCPPGVGAAERTRLVRTLELGEPAPPSPSRPHAAYAHALARRSVLLKPSTAAVLAATGGGGVLSSPRNPHARVAAQASTVSPAARSAMAAMHGQHGRMPQTTWHAQVVADSLPGTQKHAAHEHSTMLRLPGGVQMSAQQLLQHMQKRVK